MSISCVMPGGRAKGQVAHEVVALVVLPEHLHAVIEMRDGSGDYSRLWQDIKKGFTPPDGFRLANGGWLIAMAKPLLGAHCSR
jgi:hypothetical protein